MYENEMFIYFLIVWNQIPLKNLVVREQLLPAAGYKHHVNYILVISVACLVYVDGHITWALVS